MSEILGNNARNALAITTHDTNRLVQAPCAAVWIGGAGTIVGITEAEWFRARETVKTGIGEPTDAAVTGAATAVTFAGCLAGTYLPVRMMVIKTTSTATALVGLYP